MARIEKILQIHPLAAAFVMEGVLRYAELVARSKPEDYPANGLVDGEAWIWLANQIKSEIEK